MKIYYYYLINSLEFLFWQINVIKNKRQFLLRSHADVQYFLEKRSLVAEEQGHMKWKGEWEQG